MTDVRPAGAHAERQHPTLLIVGAAGGVGSAFLQLLARHPSADAFVPFGARLLLLDARAPLVPSGLRPRYDVSVMSELMIADAATFARVLGDTPASLVLDFADLDTREIASVCAARGVSYLSTAFGVWPSAYIERQERARILVRAREIRGEMLGWTLPPGVRLVLGSGMNPGVVSALVVEAVRRIARGASVRAVDVERNLRRVILTESDTTRVSARFDPHEFPATWNPTHAYEELTEIRTGYLSGGRTCWLAQPPANTHVTAWAAGRAYVGMVVPHEEVVTLGERYSHTEIGFVYGVPDQTQRQLDRVGCLEHVRPVLLAPPRFESLEGEDSVGVLLETDEYGVHWVGFTNSHAEAKPYATTATLLQVAAGAAAGLERILVEGDGPGSVKVVEDLDTAAYLRSVERVLGPVVHERVVGFEFAGFG